MSEDYSRVKKGKLRLKGVKKLTGDAVESSSGITIAKKRKRPEKEETTGVIDADYEEHGGWWMLADEADVGHVVGRTVAVETEPFTYMMSLDNGRLIIGAPHPSGEGPSPEEILTLIKPPDANWVALKSGYGKYLSIDHGGVVIAASEAIGAKERWEIVFQEGQSAIQAYNGCFLSYDVDEDGFVCARASKAREKEIIKIRTNAEKITSLDHKPALDGKAPAECEISYIKMFQHSKVPINPDDRKAVKRAKEEGDLHEVLLDRRAKMKADRYCK